MEMLTYMLTTSICPSDWSCLHCAIILYTKKGLDNGIFFFSCLMKMSDYIMRTNKARSTVSGAETVVMAYGLWWTRMRKRNVKWDTSWHAWGFRTVLCADVVTHCFWTIAFLSRQPKRGVQWLRHTQNTQSVSFPCVLHFLTMCITGHSDGYMASYVS